MQGIKGAEIADLLKSSPLSRQLPGTAAEYGPAGRFDEILKSRLGSPVELENPRQSYGEKSPADEARSMDSPLESLRESRENAPIGERPGAPEERKMQDEDSGRPRSHGEGDEKSSEKDIYALNPPDTLNPENTEGQGRIQKDGDAKKPAPGLNHKNSDPSRNMRESLGRLVESAARDIRELLALMGANKGGAQAVRMAGGELKDAAEILRRYGARAEREQHERLAQKLLGARRALAAAGLPGDRIRAIDQGLARAKNEIDRRLDSAQRRMKGQEKTAGDLRREDLDPSAGKQRLGERAFFIQGAARENSREGASDRHSNDSATFGLHHMKDAQRNEASQTPQGSAHRSALFDEQLQSLIQGAKVAVRDGRNASMELRLHPESLGRLNVKLALEEGTLIGRFLVESNEARDAVLEHITAIREELAGSGISVGEFQVNVRDERGRFVREDAGGPVSHMPHKEQASAASVVYEIGSAIAHDGAIDVII